MVGSDLDEPLEVSSTIDWLSALFRDGTDNLKVTARQVESFDSSTLCLL